MRLYADIFDEPGFRQSVKPTGRPQAHPVKKVVAAVRVLCNVDRTDRPEEYVLLSNSTTDAAVKSFSSLVVQRYDPMYLRTSTQDDLTHILDCNRDRGLSGCIGSLECSHWTWFVLPKARPGQHQGRSFKRSIFLETVCKQDFWV